MCVPSFIRQCTVHGGRFYELDYVFDSLEDFHKPWICQILHFSEISIASCLFLFSIMDIENIQQKRREREKLKCAFETAEQLAEIEKRERETQQKITEGMLSRKCVCRRVKNENETPQKKERRLQCMQVNQ